MKVYLFSEAGSYLGLHAVSDANGEVSFAVPPGTFKIRADYLGYKWWSDPVAVTTDTVLEIPINQDDVTITVSGTGPLKGLKVYLFSPSGAYLGRYKITNDAGQAIFNLPAQPYKVRVDYLGQKYWSAEFAGNSVDVMIPMAEVDITVLGNNLGIEGVTVYAFNATKSYLGVNARTDANGVAIFTLPVGDYLFRADYQKNQYWSDTTTVVANQINFFNINTGGGTFHFKVLRTEDKGLSGIKCYVFNENGSYIGLNAVTDANGLVNFDLSNGTYKFRVDYLGYQFWSKTINIPYDDSAELIIPHQTVTIDVLGEYLKPQSIAIAGIKVYLFTESGKYLNKYQITDNQGQVNFTLPQQAYKVRADYLKAKYWSKKFIWENTAITIPMGLSQIQVQNNASNPLENIKIYVFTPHGNYLGLNQTTSIDGMVEFILPQGQYKFRADYQGKHFWSEIQTVTANTITNTIINTGGGIFNFKLLKGVNLPLSNIKCYVFNRKGSYLRIYANTDSDGNAKFDLSTGDYKIRVDYLGYQFWSPIYTLPDVKSASLTIDHQKILLNILAGYNNNIIPINGVKTYLFSKLGSYLRQSKYTNENGQVNFNLPNKTYKVRIDYFKSQYWSPEFQFENQLDIIIPHGEIILHATQNGENIANARVYVFSATGSYLNQHAVTDQNGEIAFLLPVKDYKFRVDYNGKQYWSNVINILADTDISVEMDLYNK